MNIFKIKYFKEKHQERITLVRLLMEYDANLNLKSAKELLDLMIEGTSIEMKVTELKTDEFKEKLDKLNLQYEVKII